MSLVLCDWAEAIGGKLYMQGAGWNRIKAGVPANIALAALIRVPYDQTNVKRSVAFHIFDGNGNGFPPEANDAPLAEAGFEVGRPPGTHPGDEFNVPFALKLGGISFPAGTYQVEARIEGEPVGVLPFRAVGD